MRSFFVQPHFDDVALSCGGTVARLCAEAERPTVITVFSEGPEPGRTISALARTLHERWGPCEDPISMRREENARALAVLGAIDCALGLRDAIYRNDHYSSIAALTGPPHESDRALPERIAVAITEMTASARARVFLPLGVGQHVDHVVCFAAGARLASAGFEVLYYEDFPYVARVAGAVGARLSTLGGEWQSECSSIRDHLATRLAAIRAYGSQLGPLFGGEDAGEITTRYAASVAHDDDPAQRFWRSVAEANG